MSEIKDLRVYKTKKALVGAMMELLKKKRFDDITVQKLCEEATIRRATFYTHFSDKFDLYSYTLRDQFNNFPSFNKLKEKGYQKNIFRELIQDAIKFLDDNQLIVNSLIKSDCVIHMINIVSNVLSEDLVNATKDNSNFSTYNFTSQQLISRFYITGILNTYIWWIKEKPPITKEDFIELVNKLVIL